MYRLVVVVVNSVSILGGGGGVENWEFGRQAIP